MLASMTAFGRSEAAEQWGNVILEIRTVNHRYLDITVRLPDELRMLETLFRADIQQRLRRGKVDCTLRIEPGSQDTSALPVNLNLAQKLIKAAAVLPIENPQPINPIDILRWPGVINREKPDIDLLGETIRKLLAQTLDHLIDTRQREGEKIRTMILDRCDAIDTQLGTIKTRLPEILEAIRSRYQQRISELFVNEPDHDRLEQELLILAQKMDVAEELDRLQAHVGEARRVLSQDEAVGRRLDFLMQEMNREANTLSSKSAHTDTTGAAVELKVLIEQMREQIQNVE
ncbi:MAG: YicC/YloC family endoribonuclease [Gammaproteobacteria bacterium]